MDVHFQEKFQFFMSTDRV